MIGTLTIKVNAAKPNFPLQPMFAFQGSPSSIRVLEVPRSIGNWNITSVKVVAQYPDNTTIEKVAVRTGSVWVATFEGCDIAGKVGNGLSILADGIDEDGNDVTGYVLGKGDVYVIENNTDISRLLDKIAVRYIEDIPDVPTKGDLMNSNGELRMFDGNDWIVISTGEHSAVYDSQITIQKNGTSVGKFSLNQAEPKTIDIPVPSRTSDIENDSGFITVDAIPSDISSFNNDAGYITASALPTKVSELENDSGFITLAQVPTPSYIEDATGNRINANLSCTYIDNAWEVTDPSSNKHILEYVGFIQSYHTWECVEPENIKLILTYANDWLLRVFTWQEVGAGGDHDWVLDINGSYNGDSDITTIPYFENAATTYNYSAQRPVTKHLTLATKDELPTKVSELDNDVGFITASAIPSNVGAFTNDVGYLTTSSSAFTAKRDKVDMSAVVGTTYASWNLSALHSATYSPALELKWGTYNVLGEEHECWLVDDEYRKLCFFIMPDLIMLHWGVKNQDGSYIAGYGETITLSSDELSIATINGVAEITCTRTSKDGSPEISTIATLKDLSDFKNINEKRDWWDNTYPASVDDSGKYTINTFSLNIGINSYFLDQFSASGGTSTWMRSSSSYPTITTTDGLNFSLNTDSSTTVNFTMGDLKPGPATGTIGGNNYTAIANFKQTTFALKDYVDAKIAELLALIQGQ